MDQETQDTLNFITSNISFGRHVFGHFMEAMKTGYASVQTKGTITEMPGSKTIEYTYNKWRVLDTYFTSPQSAYSGGSTVIWYGPVPVWMMQYVGRYDEEAIPCLKAALRENFEAGKFNGGRGPDFFHYENDTYINCVFENNFLKRVTGEEVIFGASGKKLGWHRYQAVYMVEKPQG